MGSLFHAAENGGSIFLFFRVDVRSLRLIPFADKITDRTGAIRLLAPAASEGGPYRLEGGRQAGALLRCITCGGMMPRGDSHCGEMAGARQTKIIEPPQLLLLQTLRGCDLFERS